MRPNAIAGELRPMDYGQVLDRCFAMYRRNWRAALSLSFPLLFPSALLLGLANIGYQWAIRTQVTSPRAGDDVSLVLAGFAIVAFVGMTGLHALVGVVVHGLLAKAGSDLYLTGQVNVRETYRFGVSRLFALIVTMTLLVMAISAGLIFFIIPGIVLSIYWAFALQIVMIEQKRFVDALSRSFRLVSGHWWHAAVFLVLCGIFVWVLEMIVLSPSQILTVVEFIRHPDAIFSGGLPSVLLLAAQGLFSALAAALLAPVGAFATTLFYYDLRMRKEGVDIVTRAEQAAHAAEPAG